MHLSAFGEIWWFYQDKYGTDINRYVAFNYREGHWNIGALDRLSGTDREVFGYPLMVGADGVVYEHEIGFNHDGRQPFAEGGPLELGAGDTVLLAHRYVPDEQTAGDVETYFKVRQFPNAPQQAFGPYQAGNPVDVRFTGRQVSVRYAALNNTSWRVGAPRLEVTSGGRR